MARTKFQIGDKVRFLSTNKDFGILKGATGTVEEIEPTQEGRALYRVTYKHAITGRNKWSYFRSSELEKVEKNSLSEFVDYTPIDKIETEEPVGELPSVKPKKNKESWDSWDDFCDNFKGELFKD